jgi:hypothetical protein
MAVLSESGLWESEVYQLEVTDGPQGGVDGIDNVPPRQLANRARFLNDARLSGYIAGKGRNLLTVLGVTTIPQAMAALRTLCNGTGTPDFSKLQMGDYLDGLDLSAIPAENGGAAGQAWNATYKNNRIAIAAFNPYKGVGDTEVTKNHIRFDFVNIPLKKRMNPTNDNTGGYKATEVRAFLEGVEGNGAGDYAGTTTVTTGAFLSELKAQLGDYILPVRRLLSIRPSSGANWSWMTCSLWLPSENEVFGANAWGESGYGDGQKLHIPLYRDSYAYRIKRYNGGRDWWWLCTPHSASAVFCIANANGYANNTSPSSGGARLVGGTPIPPRSGGANF